jgi:hypothetical protein
MNGSNERNVTANPEPERLVADKQSPSENHLSYLHLVTFLDDNNTGISGGLWHSLDSIYGSMDRHPVSLNRFFRDVFQSRV